MKIFINDKEMNVVPPVTLAELLEQCDMPSAGIAVAIDDKVIPRGQHAARLLSDGEKIVIIKAFYGG